MESEPIPISAPGGFAPVVAIGQDDGTGQLVVVGTDTPLPVVSVPAERPAPLEGTSVAANLVGPFTPAALTPVYVTLSGEWSGEVRLLRSLDGGTSTHPLTCGGAGWGYYTGNVCEAAWIESESGAQLYLDLAPASGAIGWRVSQ